MLTRLDRAEPLRASNRLPSLDGVRAFAIALVILQHLNHVNGFAVPASVMQYPYGDVGVRIFFVLSGFLITTLLLQEHAREGRISLPRFFLRRSLRIFPAYFTFVLVVAALTATYSPVLHRVLIPGDFWHAFTYTYNYQAPSGSVLAPLWSLSVEEQFYLLWPIVLVLVNVRRAIIPTALWVLVVSVLRVGAFYWYPAAQHVIDRRFEFASDAIAIGCLLALLYPRLSRHRGYTAALTHWTFIGVPIATAVLPLLAQNSPAWVRLGSITVGNFGIALTLDWCMRNAEGLVGSVLNSKPLVYVGTLSYSLYLWHYLFIQPGSDGLLYRFPFVVVIIGIAALASYHLVEQPFLRVRSKLDRRFARLRQEDAAVAS